MKKRLRRVLFALAAVTMLLSAGFRLAGWLSRPALPEEDTAYFFDVGEADAALIVSGGAAVSWTPERRRPLPRSCAR